MSVTALLIDDERKALAILKNKLERLCPDIEIIGETQSPEEGLSLINDLKPQLLFLDVAMPEISGFDLLDKITDPSFEIIFVTAFQDYAIDAIKCCAIGYLVKPIDNKDLVNAVERAIKNIDEKTAVQKNRLLIENMGVRTFQNKKMVIPSQDGLEFVKISDIIGCEGIDGYTKIHFDNRETILSSRSIGFYSKLLENKEFYQIHKSYLINLSHIEKYLNEGYVVMSKNLKMPVSRSRRNDFLEHLKK